MTLSPYDFIVFRLHFLMLLSFIHFLPPPHFFLFTNIYVYLVEETHFIVKSIAWNKNECKQALSLFRPSFSFSSLPGSGGVSSFKNRHSSACDRQKKLKLKKLTTRFWANKQKKTILYQNKVNDGDEKKIKNRMIMACANQVYVSFLLVATFYWKARRNWFQHL